MYEYLVALNEHNDTSKKKVIHLKSSDGGLESNFKKRSDYMEKISRTVLDEIDEDSVTFLVDASVTSSNKKCNIEYFTIDADEEQNTYTFENEKELDKKICPDIIQLRKLFFKHEKWENILLYITLEDGKFNYKAEFKYID